jgi:hypothetical protein
VSSPDSPARKGAHLRTACISFPEDPTGFS